MSTVAQRMASQMNGAKSLGPVTAEGRRRSSLNSCKHGLSSARVVLAGESEEEWESLLGGFTAQFEPQGEIEAELVFEMAACLWRLRRAATLETLLLDTEIQKIQNEPENATLPGTALALAFTTLVTRGGPLAKLQSHEARLRRRYEKAMAELEALREAAGVADETLGDDPEDFSTGKCQNEPEPADLRAFMPELSSTGVVDKLLKLPRIQTILDAGEHRRVA